MDIHEDIIRRLMQHLYAKSMNFLRHCFLIVDSGRNAEVVAWTATGTVPVAHSISKGYVAEEQANGGAKDSASALSWQGAGC